MKDPTPSQIREHLKWVYKRPNYYQPAKKETTMKDNKQLSTDLLKKIKVELQEAHKAWPARKDLKECLDEVEEKLIKNHLSSHTKLFVKVSDTLETVIPLLGKGVMKEDLARLQKCIKNFHEEKKKMEAVKPLPTPKTKSHITRADVDRFIQTAKKGDRLIYYTGHTYDNKEYQQDRVFAYARDLCFKFEPVATNKKYYKTSGSNEWGVKYHNIITLIQKKISPQQKDKEGTIISHPVYNYIMEKL